MQLEQALLSAASAKQRVVQFTTWPVIELTSPRDVQSTSWRDPRVIQLPMIVHVGYSSHRIL